MRTFPSVPAFVIAALGLVGLALIAAEEINMVKLHIDSFSVVGVAVRTSNAREMSGDGAIAKLWARMRQENLLSQIPNRVDSRVMAVYADYESDKDGPYTYVLGAKVSSVKNIPPAMVSRRVESGTYAMFTEQGGPPARMVIDLWKRIWSLEKPAQIHRAYKTDFEVYYEGLSEDPENAHVDVYVGIQERH